MKSQPFKPVIVQLHVDNECHATSGVLFNNLVLSPAHPLILNILKTADVKAILLCLAKDQPVSVLDYVANQYRELKYEILPPGGNRVAVKLKGIFICKPIRSTFDRLLNPSIKLGQDDEFTREDRSLLLSSFLSFELSASSTEEEHVESHCAPPLRSFGDFTVLATPYGNAIMQGSAFSCRIANVVNGILFLLDIPLSKYCEGGLLLNPTYQPVGMVLTTAFHWQNENMNLTFAADLNVILQGVSRDTFHSLSPFVSTDPASRFVVLIESGVESFGTGTLIRVGRRRLVLTCSHVVTSQEQNYCTWNGRRFAIRLIYKNPIFDRPFDVAVFDAPKAVPDSAFCRSTNSNPIIGSSLKSIGFPIFDPVTVRELQIEPSIYWGKLVNYRAGMVISDTMIQAGQSGGPLFDERDRLVAISVSNFRENDTGRVFPALNCSVPMFNIISFLTEYCTTNDVQCLKKLEGSPYLQRLWNFEEAVVHSKM